MTLGVHAAPHQRQWPRPGGSRFNRRMTENTVQLVSLERLQLQQMIMGFRTTQLLHVAATLGIADLLEAGPRPVAALATMCGCRAEELYRVLRALSNLGIVCELADGRFELASLGEHLRTHTEGSLRAMAALYGERWIWNAYGNLLHSVRTGEPAFDAVHGKRFFEYLQEDAGRRAQLQRGDDLVLGAGNFGGHRRLRFHAVPHDRGHRRRAWPAPRLRCSAPVRDARGILFDLPAVCAGAQQTLEQAGVADRVSGRERRLLQPKCRAARSSTS